MNYEQILAFFKDYSKIILESSSLFLGIVNGLMLLKFNFRDRPKIVVQTIHPEVYQWWFRLPDGEYEGVPTRAYGFILYASITNQGLRKVALSSWRLFFSRGLFRKQELLPMNMPDIAFQMGSNIKILPSLGQKTLYFDGDTAMDSGTAVTGTAFYRYECFGDASWDPPIVNDEITCKFVVTDAFGKKSKCKIKFQHKSLEFILKVAPEIHIMHEAAPVSIILPDDD